MSQQYSLRWNNHQPNFISMFTTLLNTQTLVDVTLAAEGKHLQAHKVVLSACSTYFQALFVDNPSRHPIVILKDVTFADLRTMVDFMYYGEVNVTEEQLPQVLDTAKLLKIKGLTEMPETTSLTRSQGTHADFQTAEHHEAQRLSATPPSPSIKRKRRRKSSTGSTSVNMVEDPRDDNQTVELVRDGITLSSVPPRRREYHDDRHHDTSQQTTETHNMTMDALAVENNPGGMPPGVQHYSAVGYYGGQWSMMEHAYPRYSNACLGVGGVGGGGGGGPGVGNGTGPGGMQPDAVQGMSTEQLPQTETSETLTLLQRPNLYQTVLRELTGRRTKVLRRQDRVAAWLGGEHTRSEPGASSTIARAPLRQHASYPQAGAESGAECARASHTPAVRAGPPLSCNFCWNTVDEAGRILRRKTQYHCPECRTNLCIVPCFHEYHAHDAEPEVK